MTAKRHFLITAGPTREKIDEVRDWGNIFTGRTGLDLALALLEFGDATLLTSNADHAADYDGYYGRAGMLGVETFRTHLELQSLLAQRIAPGPDRSSVDAVAMSAAVSDYTPAGVYRILRTQSAGPDQSPPPVQAPPSVQTAPSVQTPPSLPGSGPDPVQEWWLVENVSAPKVKSHHPGIAVRGIPTPKLIDQFRSAWQYTGLLIKFKLEVAIDERELLRIAAASRLASAADLIVANTLEMARPATGGSGAAWLIDAAAQVRIPRNELAARTAQWIKAHLPTPPP